SSGQRTRVRQQLESTVLVEALVSKSDDTFKVADFAQKDPRLPSSNWQVAWAEAFLLVDGERLMVERWEPFPAGIGSFRVAFFIHYWQEGQPLLTSYGELAAAPAVPMPHRLARLVPCELMD